MPITAQQISDLRADLDVDETVFDDSAVSRIWERVAGAKDDLTRHEAALGLMCRQLLSSAAKLHKIKQAGDENDLSQIFAHYKALYAQYVSALEAALGSKQSVAIGSLRSVPHQTREYPDE